jgi:hypothetical protein
VYALQLCLFYGYFLYILHVYVYCHFRMNLCIYSMYLSIYILYINFRKSSVCIYFKFHAVRKIYVA